MTKISIICSDVIHPVYLVIQEWVNRNSDNYDIELVETSVELRNVGDFLFLLSCNEFIHEKIRQRFSYTLVLHASDLPKGRGWSPHIWEIVGGANNITLTLLEAEGIIDTGNIWLKESIPILATDLYDDINNKLFSAEIKLIEIAISSVTSINPKQQSERHLETFRKRTPNDSRLDLHKSIGDQLNLIRVCDPNRFPAFFDLDGQRFTVKLEKVESKS